MKRSLVVHIGMPKTGSTSIQRMLSDLAPSLEQLGIHVPLTARHCGHENLVHAIDDRCRKFRPALGGWRELADELTRCAASRFVLSAEVFVAPWLGARGAVAVAAMAKAADLDVEIIGYVRPQYQYLESSYAQRVKNGRQSARFEAVLDDLVNRPGLNYNRIFQPWRETFGDRLAVYPLEPERMPGGLLAHFLDRLGAGELTAAAAALPRANERPGARQLEVLRLVSAALDNELVDWPVQVSLLRALRRDLPAMLVGDAPFSGLSQAQVQAVTRRHAESNARFAREYAVDADGILFRDEDSDAVRRPNRTAWEEFGDAERARVARFVRDAVGVDLPVAGSDADRTARCTELHPWDPRAACVRGNDWRKVPLPEPAEFTPSRCVSVVVSGGSPAQLRDTLAALERQTYPRDLFEVVAVIPEWNPAWRRSAALDVSAVHHPGADARNAGARRAAHDILLFLDCGLLPEPGCLAAHARWLHAVADVVTWEPRPGATGAAARPEPPAVRGGEWGGALAGVPFGIGRRFFDLLGGFDASLADRTQQDIAFGRRASAHGGLLAPAREAAGPDRGQEMPGRTVRPQRPTAARDRRTDVPRFAVTVTAPPGMGPQAVETVATLLTDARADVVVLLDAGAESDVAERVRRRVGNDSRVRIGSATAVREFPMTPFRVTLPAGVLVRGDLLPALESALGDAVAGTVVLTGGSRVTIARAWALQRARRTGRELATFGSLATIRASDLQPGIVPRLVDGGQALLRAARPVRSTLRRIRAVCERLGRDALLVLRQARSIRNPRSVRLFLRWSRWNLQARWRRRLYPALQRIEQRRAHRIRTTRHGTGS